MDITSPSSVAAFLDAHPADVVLNAAAYTNVDGAESQREEALRINGLGPGVVAEACRERGLLMLHISTDYVFPGEKPEGYLPWDPTGPAINAYGESKLAGERAVRELLPDTQFLVCRTQWLYGRHGTNFVDTIRGLALTRSSLRVVDDQWGVPTHTLELARQMHTCLEAGARGVVHTVGGGGPVTWYELAREVVALSGLALHRVALHERGVPPPRDEAPPRLAAQQGRLAHRGLEGHVGRLPQVQDDVRPGVEFFLFLAVIALLAMPVVALVVALVAMSRANRATRALEAREREAEALRTRLLKMEQRLAGLESKGAGAPAGPQAVPGQEAQPVVIHPAPPAPQALPPRAPCALGPRGRGQAAGRSRRRRLRAGRRRRLPRQGLLSPRWPVPPARRAQAHRACGA